MMTTLQYISAAAAVILPLFNIPLIVRIQQRRSSQDVSLTWALGVWACFVLMLPSGLTSRSEEHTSELQSRGHLVCRLLLEKNSRDRAAGEGVGPPIRLGAELSVPGPRRQLPGGARGRPEAQRDHLHPRRALPRHRYEARHH